MAVVRQISQAYRESMSGPILNVVGLEFDNVTAQANAALRGLGTWTDQTYSSGNFVGKGAMVWTTQNANQTTFDWVQFGNHGNVGGALMHLHLHLIGTTVSGTLNTSLNVTIPNSATMRQTCSGVYSYRDNGTFGTGIWEALIATSVINFYKSDKSNWAASSGATDIRATVTLSVT